MPFATIAPTRLLAPNARARSRSSSRVVSASTSPRSSSNDVDVPTTMTMTTKTIVASCALSLVLTALPARAEVTCDWIHPCTPPPPDGKPRYELPGSTYDPAADAVKRYLERHQRETPASSASASESSAPAVTTDERE